MHITRSLNGEFTKALQETVVISNLGGCPTQFILAQRLHECAPKWSKNGPPLQMHFRRIEIKDKSTCTSFKQTYADPDLTFTLNFKFVLNEF